MATGYTRQAAANITNGAVINAADFNSEYNAIQSAFDATSGHTHDGTTGGGADITRLLDNKVFLKNGSDTSKQVAFALSGLSTATTRTWTFPDATDTFAGISATQTLTNKTIDTAGTNTIKVNGNALSASAGTATLTLPNSTDTIVGRATTDTLTNKTIDTAGPNIIKVNGNTLSASAGTATVTLPNSTDTLVGRATTDTLSNKTIDTASANTIKVNGNTLAATAGTATVTLPNSTDTLVGRATTDTLTNKTLTAPVISTISNTGTLTLPTSTDTLVGRATTDTLTNKTLTAPVISGGTIDNTVIGGTTKAAGTFTTLAATSASLTNPLPVGSGGTGLAVLMPLGQCRLSVISTTQIQLLPYNGSIVTINGAYYSIPSAGITISTAGLAANTIYYVYVYNNGGTPALEVSTTAYAISSAAGNVGVYAKSGDNTRTLVGMVRTNASTQFVDSATQRFCLNWFNRRPLSLYLQWNQQSTTSLTPVILSTSMVETLNWSDSAVDFGAYGNQWNSTSASAGYTQLYVDGAGVGQSLAPTSASAQYQIPYFLRDTEMHTEGYHYAEVALWAASGTEFANGTTVGLTWG